MPILVNELTIPEMNFLTQLSPEDFLREVDVYAFSNPPANVNITGQFGENCKIIARQGMQFRPNQITIQILSRKLVSNVTFIFLGSQGAVTFFLYGSNNVFAFAANTGNFNARISAWDDCNLSISDFAVSGGTRIELASSEIVVGQGALFADETLLQSHDGHGIVDLRSNEIINKGRGRIEIGKHVWIGRRATILRDVTIGDGSIVANSSVVTKSVAPCSLAAGVPARTIKKDVSWSRHRDFINEEERMFFAGLSEDEQEPSEKYITG